jgi:hypothetical protein
VRLRLWSVLSPGMKNGKEADAGAQMFGVAGNGEKRFGGGVEQDVVCRLLVLEGDLGDLLGDGKNHVEVFDRQQFGLSAFQPLGALRALTFRAMAVAARVVSVAFFSAVVALFEVATEGCGAADLDGSHNTELLQGKPMTFPVNGSVLSKNVGHFESGPRHPESISGALASFGPTSA